MPDTSALGPIDPSSVIALDPSGNSHQEKEIKAPWIMRKLVGVSTILYISLIPYVCSDTIVTISR